MNNNHAHRFDRIPDTDPQGKAIDITELDTQKLQSHKFGFEEFEGDRGKRLLDRILRTILPPALHRTWETIFNLPHNDAEPYVSSTLIAKQAGRSLRVIEDDLKRFKDMNLLETYSDLIDAKGGKSFAAERKNFTNLYRLAYEYLLWEQSQGFKMYPPDVRHADLIKANRELYKKLMRFENYRRILENKKTGPKAKHTEDARWENEENAEAPNLQGKIRNNVDLRDVSRKKLVPSAMYESNSINARFDKDSNLAQEKIIVTQDSPLTRRDEGDVSHDERGTRDEEGFTMGSGKGNEEQYDFVIPSKPQHGNISQREAEPSSKSNALRNAKSEEAQKFGEEVINSSISKAKLKKSKDWEQRNTNAKERDALLKRCQPIVNIMQDIASELNDQGGKSTWTIVSKIYERSQMTPEAFAELIYYARGKVRSIPGSSIKVKDLRGQPNRVPLFIRILEDTIEKGLEAMQQADAEYEAKREEHQEEQQQKAERDAELDAREKAIARAENDPESWADLRREIFASHERQQEIMGEIFPSDRENELQADQPQEPIEQNQAQMFELTTDKWILARDQIREGMPGLGLVTVSKRYQCGCGCKLIIRQGAEVGCVVCKPPMNWSRDFRSWVAEIVAQARLEEAV